MYVWIVLIFTLIRENFQSRTFCPAAAQINQIWIISISVKGYFLVQCKTSFQPSETQNAKICVDISMPFCFQRFENGPAEKCLCDLKADLDWKKKSVPPCTLSVCDFTDDLVVGWRTNLQHQLLKSKHRPRAPKHEIPKPSGREFTLEPAYLQWNENAWNV